jgi:hypothetical protein
MTTIITKGLSASTLLKIIFIGLSISIGSFSLVAGISSLFGAQTVVVFGEVKTGVMGLVYSLLIGVPFLIISTFFVWISILFGNWVYTRFQNISITYKEPSK